MVLSLQSTLVGVSGEYFVAAELSLRGYLASVTLRNSRGIDIIASNSDASRSVSIQVKTSQKGVPRWVLNRKAEDFFSDNHLYVFVLLHDIGMRPDFYIVPSKTVADYCSSAHRQFLAEKKADGSSRKNTAMRVFEDQDGKFKEKWNLLGLEIMMPHSTAISSLMDRMSDFAPVILTPCHTCQHRISGLTCSAFPDGIPIMILEGVNDHKQPFNGDHGIHWKERSKK